MPCIVPWVAPRNNPRRPTLHPPRATWRDVAVSAHDAACHVHREPEAAPVAPHEAPGNRRTAAASACRMVTRPKTRVALSFPALADENGPIDHPRCSRRRPAIETEQSAEPLRTLDGTRTFPIACGEEQHVSEATVSRYMPRRPPAPDKIQRWMTFLRNRQPAELGTTPVPATAFLLFTHTGWRTDRLRRAQGMLAAETGKTAEVAVGGDPGASVLDRYGSMVGVGDQLARR